MAGTTMDPQIAEQAESDRESILWLERVLPRVMRRLIDSEDLELPLLELPLAQLRLAQALYRSPQSNEAQEPEGETMGHLSERLGVRQNALTQAADRLIHRDLAERFSDPNDRRIVRLRLTHTGQEWVEARRARRRAHLNLLWEGLSQRERAEFLQAVHTLEMVSDRLGPRPENQMRSTDAFMLTLDEPQSSLNVNAARKRKTT